MILSSNYRKMYRLVNVFLKINIVALYIIGVWRLKLEGYLQIFSKLHAAYSNIIFGYFILFEITQFYQLVLLAGEDLYETAANLSVSLTYSLAIVKILVIKNENTTQLLFQIINDEKKYLGTDNKTIRKLYMDTVKTNYFANKLFIFLGVLTITPFYINPYLIELQNPPEILYTWVNNSTKVYLPRPLPFSSWFPFDKYKYYYFSYFLHIVAGTLGALYVVTADIVCYGLIIYPKSQITILQHYLENFKLYAKSLSRAEKDLSLEEATFLIVSECIQKHRAIIKYVEDLDKSLKYVMLIDFALASFQMATLGFQIIYVGFGIQQMFSAEYLMTMLIQLLLFYWHANEISLESAKISESIYNSDWFDCSESIKKTFLIMMMRASKPLTLNVGPFYAMSTSTALSIMRAAYSYVALLRQNYVRKEG